MIEEGGVKEGGKAGFVMATGELSNSETSRKTVRQTLVEEGFVDCIVQLTGQLFHQTQIPCSLWFKGTRGQTWCKKAAKPDPVHRRTETRVVDSRLAEAERASEDEMNRVAAVYREYRHRGQPTEVPEFCRVAAVEEIRGHGFALTPGRYVGAEGADDSDEPFEEKILSLSAKLHQQFEESRALQEVIETHIRDLGHAG